MVGRWFDGGLLASEAGEPSQLRQLQGTAIVTSQLLLCTLPAAADQVWQQEPRRVRGLLARRPAAGHGQRGRFRGGAAGPGRWCAGVLRIMVVLVIEQVEQAGLVPAMTTVVDEAMNPSLCMLKQRHMRPARPPPPCPRCGTTSRAASSWTCRTRRRSSSCCTTPRCAAHAALLLPSSRQRCKPC